MELSAWPYIQRLGMRVSMSMNEGQIAFRWPCGCELAGPRETPAYVACGKHERRLEPRADTAGPQSSAV